jgi:hypothetical protein
MIRSLHRLLVVVLTVLTLASSPGLLAAKTQSLPFHARLTTVEDLVFVPPGGPRCPLGVIGDIAATGVATHVGTLTGQFEDCPDIRAIPFVFTDGMFTLTATNGDQLFGTYAGQLNATETTAEDSIYVLEHTTFVITGGTGRFAGAQGDGVITGTEKIIPGIFQDVPGSFTLTGRIILLHP